MNLNLIVAIGRDGAIGKNGDLIWHLPGDLKRFKALTLDHPVIMGRKTWESLPKRPLPKRRNIVVTRQKDYEAPGAEVVNSIQEALDLTKGLQSFVIGGAEIYKAAVPYVDTLYLTLIDESCPQADTFLNLPLENFVKIEETSPEDSPYPSFVYQTYKLKHIDVI